MKRLTPEQFENIFEWLNSWDQLKDTAIPLRFKECYSPSPKHINKILPKQIRKIIIDILKANTHPMTAEAIRQEIKAETLHNIEFHRITYALRHLRKDNKVKNDGWRWFLIKH